MTLETAERAVREGDLDVALVHLQEQIRRAPDRAELRVFLFQLLCVLGQWDRALGQLNVAAELDAGTLPMAQMYREAIHCERLRADVFAGTRSPLVFGEPDEWLAWLIEAVATTDAARAGYAAELRAKAFERAEPSSGFLDGRRFEWIADADSRLGPVCEAVINGRYYWVPFARLSRVDLEPPADLRDLVWTPAHFRFANGGEAVGVIPTRYPGSESADEPLIRLARKTVWYEPAFAGVAASAPPAEVFVGLGQRMLATDAGEHALMDVRSLVIGDSLDTAAAGAHDA